MPASRNSQDYCIPCLWPHSRLLAAHASAGDSWTLTGKSGSVSCGVTAPFSWPTQGFVFSLQESVSPVMWKFRNQIPMAFQVKFPAGSHSHCQIPGWEICGLRTFGTVWELLWYHCSPVCGLSAWRLYGGANDDLLQECTHFKNTGLPLSLFFPPEIVLFWTTTCSLCRLKFLLHAAAMLGGAFMSNL